VGAILRTASASRLSTFRECPRKFRYKYLDNREPAREASALAIGRAWHSALERWWDGDMEAAAQWLIAKAEDIEAIDAAKLTAMLRHYTPPADGWDVLATEREFDVPVLDTDGSAIYGWRFTGRVDLLLGNGEAMVVVDHKTTATDLAGSSYWDALQVDAQMAAYCLAFGTDRFAYDVARKPSLKPSRADEKKATESEGAISVMDAYQERIEVAIGKAPHSWFQWREYVKTEEDISEARRDLAQTIHALDSTIRRGRYYRNPNSCTGRFGVCPYLEVCCGRESLDGDGFRDREWRR